MLVLVIVIDLVIVIVIIIVLKRMPCRAYITVRSCVKSRAVHMEALDCMVVSITITSTSTSTKMHILGRAESPASSSFIRRIKR